MPYEVRRLYLCFTLGVILRTRSSRLGAWELGPHALTFAKLTTSAPRHLFPRSLRIGLLKIMDSSPLSEVEHIAYEEDDGQFDVTIEDDDLQEIVRSKKLHLAVNPKYGQGWTREHGFREFVQNWQVISHRLKVNTNMQQERQHHEEELHVARRISRQS